MPALLATVQAINHSGQNFKSHKQEMMVERKDLADITRPHQGERRTIGEAEFLIGVLLENIPSDTE